ncbi:MAG: hybrid sensor histidine kinase/response regulator [Christensenellales bacterium]|jgi:CheY-like chemotaxis protein|nr:response regulator [Christensenellaceae bacterium]
MEEAKRYKTEAAQRDAFVKICHDMRTPLSSVMHLAQILEIEADRPDRVRERAAEIAVSAEYLLGLADDIVDIYKLGGGRIDIKKEPFSPYELAEDIQKMLCPQIKDAGHELAVCIAEAAPDMLLGDKRRLERILLNLIANSVQHTAAGGKTVLCISCAQGDRVEKLPLVFTVSDNGEGMEQSILDAALAEGETPAAGLGIAIAKGLTELMGGSIAAKSGREKGTVFRVELAFDRMEEKEKTEAESEALAGKRLLLAEDDRLCGEILCELLEDETGRPVSITANGRAALEMFESANGEYDAIIMDVQMPVMNGYEAARAIRRSGCGNAKTVPIIALTADASEESARAAADSGMNGCLTKPVNIDRLRKAVAAALKSLSVAYR